MIAPGAPSTPVVQFTATETRLPPRTMRRRFTWVVLPLAAVAGCGASCKKGPESATGDDQDVPVIDLPGVDTSSLIASEKKTFSKIVHDYSSPCGDPITLEVCVKENRPCKKCLPAAKAVAQLVPKGEGEKEIREWLDNRFDDKTVKSIDLGNSPSLGPSDAPIVIVEFADFECPHCGAAMPVIHMTLDQLEFKGKTRFVFKEFPLAGHEHADPAARAAIAALNQGKFWEMHDQLFTHQEQLGDNDILGYAKKLGLNMEQFKTDWQSQATKDAIARDKDLGSKLGVQGTPSIFIDGRKFTTIGHADFAEQLRDWLRLEMQLDASAGSSPPPPAPSPSVSGATPPATSASTAPSASASTKGSK